MVQLVTGLFCFFVGVSFGMPYGLPYMIAFGVLSFIGGFILGAAFEGLARVAAALLIVGILLAGAHMAGVLQSVPGVGEDLDREVGTYMTQVRGTLNRHFGQPLQKMERLDRESGRRDPSYERRRRGQ